MVLPAAAVRIAWLALLLPLFPEALAEAFLDPWCARSLAN